MDAFPQVGDWIPEPIVRMGLPLPALVVWLRHVG